MGVESLKSGPGTKFDTPSPNPTKSPFPVGDLHSIAAGSGPPFVVHLLGG